MNKPNNFHGIRVTEFTQCPKYVIKKSNQQCPRLYMGTALASQTQSCVGGGGDWAFLPSVGVGVAAAAASEVRPASSAAVTPLIGPRVISTAKCRLKPPPFLLSRPFYSFRPFLSDRRNRRRRGGKLRNGKRGTKRPPSLPPCSLLRCQE